MNTDQKIVSVPRRNHNPRSILICGAARTDAGNPYLTLIYR
ncbi:hypothetical protein ABES58_29340 [Paenibacillus lautus]